VENQLVRGSGTNGGVLAEVIPEMAFIVGSQSPPHVTLGPLRLGDITQLIRDVLHGTLAEAEPLARVVLEKTAGNPFFVIQFLKTLKQEGYLTFDYRQGRWAYHLDQITGAEITDNVIDLMTRKIQRLSPSTQRIVTRAACIGNPFDRDTLAMVSEHSPEATADGLSEARGEGLILPAVRHDDSTMTRDADAASAPAYVFLHDRVQQAAYALIPKEQHQSVHLTVGRFLRARGAGTD
jgi:predicted ATPase